MNTGWRRVTKTHPCPICGRPDWCIVSAAGNAVICPRTADGAKKNMGEAGYLHMLNDDPMPVDYRRQRTLVCRVEQPMAVPDHERWKRLSTDFQAAVKADNLAHLARGLGVSVDGLRRLGIGWTGSAWSFPMMDSIGNVLGIRLRKLDGTKLSIRGGHEGLFIASGIASTSQCKPLLICEGATDCAALCDMGLDAIGRPSCLGGIRLVVEMVRTWRVSAVIVVADADEPGRRGAESLAAVLAAYCPDVSIMEPPTGFKDVRAWRQAGAMREDVIALMESAAKRNLRVRLGKE